MNIERVVELIKSDAKKDLHIHSAYSDGALEPDEIVRRWSVEGYKVIAITDHDGITGSVLGRDAARDYDVEFIPGIEFDSLDKLGKDLHVLGYGIDYDNEFLRLALDNIELWRSERNDTMLEALNAEGYEMTLDDVVSINDGRYIGKPTFAAVMVKKGYFPTISAAFENVLKRIKSIDSIQKKVLSSEDVIKVIHASGGVAVLAHPMEYIRTSEKTFEEYEPRLIELLDTFVEYGIDGIECWHPSANERASAYLEAYADSHGLLKTSGSDFHRDTHKRDYSAFFR